MAVNIGIDEVGRGAWAGPLLLVAAVDDELHTLENNPKWQDSKKLDDKKRKTLTEELLEVKNVNYIYAEISAELIDKNSMAWALKTAAKNLLTTVAEDYGDVKINTIYIDGTINFLKNTPWENKVETAPKLDETNHLVAAASIVAKHTRDTHMLNLCETYPQYGWEKNKGYPSPKHKETIKKLGPTTEHRVSWKWAEPWWETLTRNPVFNGRTPNVQQVLL